MPAESQGVDYFFRRHPLTAVQVRASLRVRRLVYDWFSARIGGVRGRTFLDHGSTPDTERGDSNCFIRWLLADGAAVYAASPEDIHALEAAYPGLHTVPWPPRHEDLPQVDGIISCAVLEHVGGRARQEEYISTLLSLGRRVLLITPNRFHWLEFHTKLPLCHWLPKPWHRRVLSCLGLAFWAREENLNLVSRGELQEMLDAACRGLARPVSVNWCRPRYLGMTSNLAVLVESA